MSDIIKLKISDLRHHPDLSKIAIVDDVLQGLQDRKTIKPEHRQRAEQIEREAAGQKKSIQELGVVVPVIVTRKNASSPWLIVDGRTRCKDAQAAGHKDVPCMAVRYEDAPAIIDAMLVNRRFWSKSAKAYIAVLRYPQVLDSKHGGDRKTDQAQKIILITQAELAARFSVSEGMIQTACELRKDLLKRSESARAKAEAAVFAGMSLDGVSKGLKGASIHVAGPDTPGQISNQYKYFSLIGFTQCRLFRKCSTEDERQRAAEELPSLLRSLPIGMVLRATDDLREALAEITKKSAGIKQPRNHATSLAEILACTETEEEEPV